MKTIEFLRKKSIGKCHLEFLLHVSPVNSAFLLTLKNNKYQAIKQISQSAMSK